MKISIAVPSFNHVRWLDANLDSLACQDHPDFEVLIADGGSTDGSLDRIAARVSRDTRFRLVSTADAGQADAIRRAFAHASGDVLGFLNSDDCYLAPDVLSGVARVFDAHPDAGLASFTGRYLDADGRDTGPVRLRYHPLDSLANLRWRSSVLQPATFWRRAVWDTVGFDPSFHYCFDALFFWEAWRRFGWVEDAKPVAGYRLHGANKSAGVRAVRVRELARFERIKFGRGSARARFLDRIAALIERADRWPVHGARVKRLAYLAVNSLAFATAYRTPSI
ncbi:MAG: glycosyltransferase [Burkholderiales bacterium]|nr:glycosyltransferase [Burkholderiales bacterium]